MVYMMCVYEVHVNNRISDRWGEISTSGGEIRTVGGESVHISHKTVKQYMHDRHFKHHMRITILLYVMEPHIYTCMYMCVCPQFLTPL